MNYFLLISSSLIIHTITYICSKDSIYSYIKSSADSNVHQYDISNNYNECIDDLISKGEYDLLELYLNTLSLNQIAYKDSLMSSIKKKQNKLKQLKEKYILIKKNEAIEIIHPSIKWKENSQYVFLQFVYSVNHNESLLCEHLENVDFDLISDSNLIHFQGDCISKIDNRQIRFIADIALEDDLNKLMSMYKDLSQEKGKYRITLRKKSSKIWNQLYKNEKDIPFNLIKWDDDINNIEYIQIHNN